MGLYLLIYVWFTVIAAHCTFFGGLWLVFKQFGLPTEFIEKAVQDTVYRVLKESFDTDSVADNKGLVEPERLVEPWQLLWYCCILVILGASTIFCWCCGWFSRYREQRGQLTDSPRSPQPELAVIARQQLAEIRLRRHAH